MMTTRILLVDDHPMIREGIRHLLAREGDFQVVGEAGDGEEAIRLAEEHLPDVILMDVGMPKIGGLEVTKHIKARHPSIAVLVLTVHDEDEYVMGLIQAGAAGYILKSTYGEELVHAIRAVRSGHLVLHPHVAQGLLRRCATLPPRPSKTDRPEQLTAREYEVLRLVATGMSNKDIARTLGIGVRTVKGHLISIFGKMGIGSRTEAVLSALKNGMISLEDVA
ncbi:MAG: response regulator transcription factor [Chloroflexi bacterium]|nr:response regulator transcription factor [Chloroflexota bacterium]